MVPAARLRAFQRHLLGWYRIHRRDLPWRKTRDPYKILVSEIMLQQTQVERVTPKYLEFLHRYPTLTTLAHARTAELRRVWYPLGYNARPLRLRRIAQRALREHGGRIPDSYDGLLAMDGVGRYTAGAVLSFAFKRDAPIVDTNVARLLSRCFEVKGDLKRGRAQRILWRLAAAVLPRGKGHLINQAMMDFGATVCTARAPQCPTCVLRRMCRSYPMDTHPPSRRRWGNAPRGASVDVARGVGGCPPKSWRMRAEQGTPGLPGGSMPRRPRHADAALAVVERRGAYLICRRRAGGHLGGYWEFPGGKREPGESWEACLRRELREELGVALRSVRPHSTMRYRYADRAIFFRVFRCGIAGGRPRPLHARALRWVRPSQLKRYRFPPANRPLLERLVRRCPTAGRVV